METGYVKIYRSLKDKGYFKQSEYVHLWVCLLMKASYQEKEYLFNGEIHLLQPGQFITGRKRLSIETGISQTTIERILKVFESEHQIGQQTFTKFRIITICNWDKYQTDGQQNGQQTDSKRTTNGQQADTIKKEKKDKKEKKEYIPKISFRENVTLTEEEHQSLINQYGKDSTDRMLDTLDNYKGAHGKKYKSDYRAILSWVADKVKQIPGGYDDADKYLERVKKLSSTTSK